MFVKDVGLELEERVSTKDKKGGDRWLERLSVGSKECFRSRSRGLERWRTWILHVRACVLTVGCSGRVGGHVVVVVDVVDVDVCFVVVLQDEKQNVLQTELSNQNYKVTVKANIDGLLVLYLVRM